MNFNPCPVCGSTQITVIERGEAERDTLTGQTWFTSEIGYFCRCMNDACVHETEEKSTYEDAVELWNKGIVHKWEEKWYRKYHPDSETPVSDFY